MRFSIGAAQDQNKAHRSHMEDTYAVHADVGGLFFAGVYDGHNGDEVSYLAQHTLHRDTILLDQVLRPDVRLTKAFEAFDARLQERKTGAGSTAVAVLISPEGKGYVAWAGDSLALMMHPSTGFSLLTPPHTTQSFSERERILASGGEFYEGYIKVPNAHYYLGMTRAFGDCVFKQYGVIATPSTKVFSLEPGMRLLLCSDGVLSTARPKPHEVANLLMRGRTPQEAANQIVSAALRSWGSDDNLTALVIEMTQ